MPSPIAVPPQLLSRPFTIDQAREVGLTRQVLRGRRFAQMHRGVYRHCDLDETVEVRVRAALLTLPRDAALSHVSALWWHGVTLRDPRELHFSTNSDSKSRDDEIVLHRRLGRLSPTTVRGIPVLGPDRSLVDASTILGHVDLVRAGDWLVRLSLTTPDQLGRFALESHLDGVVRCRRATPQVRTGVDSVKETDVRLMLVHAHLPAPDVNRQILDDRGDFLARGDLVYARWKVLVEYDGWHHERDAAQRQKDHLRRERLEAAGWIVIVITVADLEHPISVVARVHRSLVSRGYTGSSPVFSTVWRRWFGA